MFLTSIGLFEAGMLVKPLMSRVFKMGQNKDILISGYTGSKEIPVLDRILESITPEMSYIQKKSADKLVKLVRNVANTKAFEHVTKQMVHKHWVFTKQLDTSVQLL